MTATTILSTWYRLDDPKGRWTVGRVDAFLRGLADHAPRRSGWSRRFFFSGHAPIFTVAAVRAEASTLLFVALPSENAEAIRAQFRYDFPDCALVETDAFPSAARAVRTLGLEHEPFHPLRLDRAHARLRAALEHAAPGTGFIVTVRDVADDGWRSDQRVRTFLAHPKSPIAAAFLASSWWTALRLVGMPFVWFYRGFRFLIDPFSARNHETAPEAPIPDAILAKTRETGFRTGIFLIEDVLEGTDRPKVTTLDASVAHLCDVGDPLANRLRRGRIFYADTLDLVRLGNAADTILTAGEIAALAAPETPKETEPQKAEPVVTETVRKEPAAPPPPRVPRSPDATPVGLVTRDPQSGPFGIMPEDRRRHVYLIGKTGTGKTTLLANMLLDDIERGKGVALVDPHGDISRTILEHIPKRRTNDVILFDPSDADHPIAFNLFDAVEPRLRPVVASGIVAVFKRLYGNSWGPRLEYILRNAVMSLLQMPDATLMSIIHLLTNPHYRARVVERLDDPVLRNFWMNEFERMDRRQMTEATSPILNKVGQFLSNPLLRNILLQPKSAFSLRWAMDRSKILIVRLPKGTIGEDVSAFLGALFVTRLQIEAMSRADVPEAQRPEFSLYVDEFQNFATESFASILSEARKFSLSLVLANQYVAQMPEELRQAIFGNVWSMLCFQVGPLDAPVMERVMGLGPNGGERLQTLPRFHIFARLSVDGSVLPAFEARALPPAAERSPADPERRASIERVSRERYASDAAFVEKKIAEGLRAVEVLGENK